MDLTLVVGEPSRWAVAAAATAPAAPGSSSDDDGAMTADADPNHAAPRSPRPASIASTSTLTLTPFNGLTSASSSRVPSVVAPKLDLISALARPSRTASTSTSGDHAFALSATPSLSPSVGTTASSAFDHLSFDRPRPSSSSSYSFSTTRTSHTEHNRQHPSPSTPGQSAEALLLAAKLRLSRSTSLEGSRSEGASFDPRPGGSSAQRSSFYGTAGSTSYNGSQDFARTVARDDVFAPGFTRVVHAAESGESLADIAAAGAGGATPGSSSISARSASRNGGNGYKGKQPAEPALVRYVLPYGLSGPALEKNALNEALLAPAFEVGASEPTLANSLAGSSSARTATAPHTTASLSAAQHAAHQMMYAAQGSPVGVHSGALPMNDWMFNGGMGLSVPLAGPNAVPLHLVHGLTSTSPDPYPIDFAELAAYETGISAAGAAGGGHGLMGLEGQMDAMNIHQQSHDMVDPRTLRAIALTSQAVAVYRTHTVTRRFRDPFRESLERIARQSGRLPSEGSDGVRSGIVSPSAESIRYYGRSRPNSPGVSDNSENPVRNLKRVWSGGLNMSRNVLGMTRADQSQASSQHSSAGRQGRSSWR